VSQVIGSSSSVASIEPSNRFGAAGDRTDTASTSSRYLPWGSAPGWPVGIWPSSKLVQPCLPGCGAAASAGSLARCASVSAAFGLGVGIPWAGISTLAAERMPAPGIEITARRQALNQLLGQTRSSSSCRLICLLLPPLSNLRGVGGERCRG